VGARSTIVWFASLVLALFIVGGLVPTPNTVGGGAAIMCVLIVLTAFFKATIEYWLKRRKKN
jgi:hypothetical protein